MGLGGLFSYSLLTSTLTASFKVSLMACSYGFFAANHAVLYLVLGIGCQTPGVRKRVPGNGVIPDTRFPVPSCKLFSSGNANVCHTAFSPNSCYRFVDACHCISCPVEDGVVEGGLPLASHGDRARCALWSEPPSTGDSAPAQQEPRVQTKGKGYKQKVLSFPRSAWTMLHGLICFFLQIN